MIDSRRIRPVLLAIALSFTAAGCGSAPSPQPLAVTTGDRLLREATSAFDADRMHRALLLYAEAEDHFRSLDDHRGVSLALISQAEILLLLGEHKLAGDVADGLHTALRRTGKDPSGNPRYRMIVARIAAARGDTAAALDMLAALTARGDAIGEAARLLECREHVRREKPECIDSVHPVTTLGEARLHRLKASTALQAERNDEALQSLDRALDIYRHEHYRPGIAATLHEIAQARLAIAKHTGDEAHVSPARDALDRSLEIHVWLRDSVHAIEVVALRTTLAEDDAQEWQELLDVLKKKDTRWSEIDRRLSRLRR